MIYADGGALITKYVNIVPANEVHKVVNRLLDGSWHVQTIGAAASSLKVVIHAENESVRARIDLAMAMGELLTITLHGVSTQGVIIDNKLEWNKVAGSFSTSFSFGVVV